ncbi:MAG: outer membrane protein assembly factor BamD, partial [bacterium]
RQFKIGNLFLQGKTIGFLKINPSGSYKRAIAIYGKLLSNAPFSDLAPNAQYNLGMAYMHKKDYVEASIEFEKIPLRYPHSEFVASAKYQLGVCAYRQASAAPYDQEAAQEAINRLREYTGAHPPDKSVELARDMLSEREGKKAAALYQIGSFYEKRGNPKASLIYFKEVIRDYPLTRFAEKARKVAAREERKLAAANAVSQAEASVDEIERLIESQNSTIRKIKGKGRARYQFWKYVIPRKLSADEECEVAERRQEIGALKGRLSLAELDLREKKELMANRLRMLNAEAAIERLEDDLHSAQVELQVAQNKLSEIGDLPDAESGVLESAAAEIAGKEELARSKEEQLEQLRVDTVKIGEATAVDERRIKERYQQRRTLLSASLEGGRGAYPGVGGRRWWKWDEALESYDRASLKLMELRRVWPDYRSGDVSRYLRACSEGLKDVREESARQQYAELSADLEARLRKNPDDVEAHLALGDIYQSHGKTDMAVEEYKKVISLQPLSAKAYYNLGITVLTKRDFRSAHDAFRKTLEIDPGQPTACHGLGVACKELGDYDCARRGFEEALKLDPSFAPSCFSLGQLYQSVLGDKGKAAIYWEKYLELRPDDPQASRIREWIDQEKQPDSHKE